MVEGNTTFQLSYNLGRLIHAAGLEVVPLKLRGFVYDQLLQTKHYELALSLHR